MADPTLILGTRKAYLELQRRGGKWQVTREAHAGIPVTYAFHDARHDTTWASLDHGHWGQKLSRSKDGGATWEEVTTPKYPEGAEVKPGQPATMESIWVITPGGADQPGRLWLGTNPGGMFRSDDGGESFELVSSLWDRPERPEGWFGGGRDTPGIHSIEVDPRDSRRIWIGISCAGVYESTDDGATWAIRNQGLKADFLPNPDAETGHDPHFIMACAAQPDVIWMQNHCGIFRTTDGAASWEMISEKGTLPHFGFPVAAHEKEPNTAWVVPGIADEKRMPVDGALCVCRTEDGGKTWTDLRNGLPQQNAYDVVFRHALDIQGDTLAFGSTTGNVYFSADRGDTWEVVSHNLPPVYSVRFR